MFQETETLLLGGIPPFRGRHSNGRTNTPDWPTFLKFADHYLKVMPAVAK
jgi:hypothetical protein